MKSIDVKRIGSIVTGAAMLGAALAGPVSAGLDSTGLTGFFYDADYNPLVQIVVGEKGMATDAVAAGNIAATIGNLAYATKEVAAAGTAEGEVVISSSAIGATGDYVQDDTLLEALADFYDEDDGWFFDDAEEYERGDFTQYTLTCEEQLREEAAILMEGTYNNVHCLFCQTLCLEALENPSHEMLEKISVDYSLMSYYETGLNDDDSEELKLTIDKDAIVYTVEAGYIPLKRITRDIGGSADDYIDFEYRGKMILLGEEYYVREVEGNSKIYLSKGKVLDDISSEGYTAEYNGYKFKIDHLIYSAEYEVAGILLDVEKPDGTVVQTQLSKMANGRVDDLEISGVYAEEADALATASIIVYDTTTDVLLEDGEDITLGGEVWDDWQVDFHVVDECEDADADGDFDADGPSCDISEYDDMDVGTTDGLLQEIEITYKHKLDGKEALEEDEYLEFPGGRFKLTFKGFRTNDFRESASSGQGEGDIIVERGDENYQIVFSFTGDDGNRYDNVRLDEGPFGKGDLFVVGGVVYEYVKSEDIDNDDDVDADDQVEVTLDPVIRGGRVRIKLNRYCDPEDEGNDDADGNAIPDCEDVDDEITVRTLALTDAMDDDDATRMENDDELEIETDELFVNADTFNAETGGLVMMYTGDKLIAFSTAASDTNITVNPTQVGLFDDFEVDDHQLSLWVEVEDDLLADVDSAVDNSATDDENADGDDDDILVMLMDENGEQVVIDLTDRDYNENDKWSYDNAIGMYAQVIDCTTADLLGTTVATSKGACIENETTATQDVVVLDEDIDTTLITPRGGSIYNIDWGVDNRIDSVEVVHPQDDVFATLFLGTEEEETIAEYTITKDDVGTVKSAACCTFTVEDFAVAATDGATAATQEVAPVGNLVVPESAADTTKNLVLVGGPAVNGMTEAAGVTAADISAEADKYVVKKVDGKVVVAGWTADDTVAAGNALISWLKTNVH